MQDSDSIVLMKILSNPSRYNILRIIYTSTKDICVNEISELAQISQSLASHQLAYLAASGVVEGHRMGQTICYVPAKNPLSEKLSQVLQILSE